MRGEVSTPAGNAVRADVEHRPPQLDPAAVGGPVDHRRPPHPHRGLGLAATGRGRGELETVGGDRSRPAVAVGARQRDAHDQPGRGPVGRVLRGARPVEVARQAAGPVVIRPEAVAGVEGLVERLGAPGEAGQPGVVEVAGGLVVRPAAQRPGRRRTTVAHGEERRHGRARRRGPIGRAVPAPGGQGDHAGDDRGDGVDPSHPGSVTPSAATAAAQR
jgi:hypothetical protein